CLYLTARDEPKQTRIEENSPHFTRGHRWLSFFLAGSRPRQRGGIPGDFLGPVVGSRPKDLNGAVNGGLRIQGHEFTNGIPSRTRREADQPAVQAHGILRARLRLPFLLRKIHDHDGHLILTTSKHHEPLSSEFSR